MSRPSATITTRRHNERTSVASDDVVEAAGRKPRMNISFRMSITTSGAAAASGGLLVTTGVQTGSRRVFGGATGNQSNEGFQLYDARNAENLMRMWRNATDATEDRNHVEETGQLPAITTSEATASLPVRKASDKVISGLLVSAPSVDSSVLRKMLSDETSGKTAGISASEHRFAKIGISVLPTGGGCPAGTSSSVLSSTAATLSSSKHTQRAEERRLCENKFGVSAAGTHFLDATTATTMAMSCQLLSYADDEKPRRAADGVEEGGRPAAPKPSIKLNVFSADEERSGRGNAVELYVPPHYFTAAASNAKLPPRSGSVDVERLSDASDSESWVLNDTTTTTTTVEVFRERCGGGATADYFMLPPPPLSGANAAPQLIRAGGAPYELLKRTETRFGNNRAASSSINKEVRWMEPRTGSAPSNPDGQQQQQQQLPYFVREPSSLYGSGSVFHSRSASACSGGALNPTERSYGNTSGKKTINGYGTWNTSEAEAATQADVWYSGGTTRNQSAAGNYESGYGAFGGYDSLSRHDNDDNNDDAAASVATILRRQCRENSVERLMPSSRCASASAWTASVAEPIYSRISSPSTIRSRWDRESSFGTEAERVKPPLPPKKRAAGKRMRRTASQPDIGSGGERSAPPRPRSRKPSRHPQPQQQQAPHRRSASSNEIIQLYQTRDCLGNVLYEV